MGGTGSSAVCTRGKKTPWLSVLTGNPYPILRLLAERSEELKGEKTNTKGNWNETIWSGQGDASAQQAEDPPRHALPQFPHDVTAR